METAGPLLIVPLGLAGIARLRLLEPGRLPQRQGLLVRFPLPRRGISPSLTLFPPHQHTPAHAPRGVCHSWWHGKWTGCLRAGPPIASRCPTGLGLAGAGRRAGRPATPPARAPAPRCRSPGTCTVLRTCGSSPCAVQGWMNPVNLKPGQAAAGNGHQQPDVPAADGGEGEARPLNGAVVLDLGQGVRQTRPHIQQKLHRLCLGIRVAACRVGGAGKGLSPVARSPGSGGLARFQHARIRCPCAGRQHTGRGPCCRPRGTHPCAQSIPNSVAALAASSPPPNPANPSVPDSDRLRARTIQVRTASL